MPRTWRELYAVARDKYANTPRRDAQDTFINVLDQCIDNHRNAVVEEGWRPMDDTFASLGPDPVCVRARLILVLRSFACGVTLGWCGVTVRSPRTQRWDDMLILAARWAIMCGNLEWLQDLRGQG